MSWEGLTEDIAEMFSRLEGVPETRCRHFRASMHVTKSDFNAKRSAEAADKREAASESVGRIAELIKVYGGAVVFQAFGLAHCRDSANSKL